ncbi:Transcription antitermination protein RfaH [bacterium HR37]|nr:Transcription antitermination protein RfaH [bacterium HR37]
MGILAKSVIINNSYEELGEQERECLWYAVYTKSRHEKVAEINLRVRGVRTFLPLREVVSQWKDRKKLISVPLFPSYLFVNIRKEDIYKVIYTRGVLKVVGCNGTPVPIPKEQIESVRVLVESKLKYDPYPYFDKGREVIIKSGPLQGVVGRIVDKKSKHKVVLSIDLIKRSVCVEIDVLDIEPI